MASPGRVLKKECNPRFTTKMSWDRHCGENLGPVFCAISQKLGKGLIDNLHNPPMCFEGFPVDFYYGFAPNEENIGPLRDILRLEVLFSAPGQ
jgi:hypothetical protein